LVVQRTLLQGFGSRQEEGCQFGQIELMAGWNYTSSNQIQIQSLESNPTTFQLEQKVFVLRGEFLCALVANSGLEIEPTWLLLTQ
jgi:hypothetical protein